MMTMMTITGSTFLLLLFFFFSLFQISAGLCVWFLRADGADEHKQKQQAPPPPPLSSAAARTEWAAAIAAVASAAEQGYVVVVVAGPKDVGKSTLCRLMANALLGRDGIGRIGYLETDVGQGEFSPPVRGRGRWQF